MLTTINYLENELFAADNCDPTSTCQNTGSFSTQTNNCFRSDCRNEGDFNTQVNNCSLGSRCDNRGFSSIQTNDCFTSGCANLGDSSTQVNNCIRSGVCTNFGLSSDQTNECADSVCGNTVNDAGISSKQENKCARSSCVTFSEVPHNSQHTECANSFSCLNIGDNTNMISNGAACTSGVTGTTTICQPGRIIVRPN